MALLFLSLSWKIVKLSNQISVFQYRILYAPFVFVSVFFGLPEIVEWDKLGHCVEFTIQTTENQLLYVLLLLCEQHLICFNKRCIAKHTQYCDTVFHENATSTVPRID